MTNLEAAIEKQRAIEQSQRDFQGEISKLCVAERVRREAARSNEMQRANFHQYAGQEHCCPYREGK